MESTAYTVVCKRAVDDVAVRGQGVKTRHPKRSGVCIMVSGGVHNSLSNDATARYVSTTSDL